MRSVLVTGSAQGIGRATSLRLASQGWRVFAGVRRPEDGDSLVAAGAGGIVPLLLDVTDAAQVDALNQLDTLDAVVNNAAVMVTGPVEAIDTPTLRSHFEVNVVGAMAVTRAVLPRIRASKGRVVFISSVSGRVTTPWMGPYCASKFALEAMADALRMEVKPWGIRVSIVEPGVTATDIWKSEATILDTTDTPMSPELEALYSGHREGMDARMRAMRNQSVPIERVVKTVERALGDRSPDARYTVDLASDVRIGAIAAMPSWMADAILSRMSGIPRDAP